MNVEELSLIGPAVDLQTVDSIHKKRLLAFINHFVISNASFLNNLSQSCDQRFLALEAKMSKLEAAIIILESKLDSVPGLDEGLPVAEVKDTEPESVMVVKQEVTEMEAEEQTPAAVVVAAAPAAATVEPTEDPVLKKYTKMIQFGVPVAAVKHKMRQEGVDPGLLDG